MINFCCALNTKIDAVPEFEFPFSSYLIDCVNNLAADARQIKKNVQMRNINL